MEVYSQIPEELLLPEFKSLIITSILDNFKQLSFSQLGALVHHLKQREDNESISKLKDIAVDDPKLLKKP